MNTGDAGYASQGVFKRVEWAISGESEHAGKCRVDRQPAGIMAAVQNSGLNGLVQQAVNVQANLSVGK